MRWRDREGSKNIEDRRGQGGRRMGFPFPGGGRRMRMPGRRGGGISLWTILILLGFMYFTGKCDPSLILRELSRGGGQLQTPSGTPQREQLPRFDIDPLPDTGKDLRSPGQESQLNVPRPSSAEAKDEMGEFTSVVLRETERVWHKLFKMIGRTYIEPKLVLFDGYTQSGCGAGMRAMGPFYCPLDSKVYIDLSFYSELKRKFGAPGDFAQAYVIAHEVGHHVQNLLGTATKVQQAKRRLSKRAANALQVRMELQADCFAGIWARHADAQSKILEDGDLEEALNAAAKIGDDNIQRKTQGYVVEDAFTHGSSVQRKRWFKRGYDTGNMRACDAFNAQTL